MWSGLPTISPPSRPHRRIVVHFDVIMGDGANFPIKDIDDLLAFKFEWADDPAVRLDSMWWDWNEGHQAPFPSRTQVLIDAPGFRRWADDGVNIMQIFLEASQQRGLENFYLYRINGSDNDLGPVSPIPMKEQHPELLMTAWNANGYWNFALDEVHDYKLGILREVAEDYDYDGITLDFARIPLVLPWGRQWELRDRLTTFMRKVRRMTLDVAEARGRPLLLAVRVPENLMGCHFDGIDIETWARELLVDLMVIGCRSFDVDIAAFRRITAGTPIKLYPAIDDHHSSDGYMWPPIEVFRGVFANWFHQGADGVQTFNWEHSSLESAERIGLKALNWPAAEAQYRAYVELAEPERLPPQGQDLRRPAARRRPRPHRHPQPGRLVHAAQHVLQLQHVRAAARPAGLGRRRRHPADAVRGGRPGGRGRAPGAWTCACCSRTRPPTRSPPTSASIPWRSPRSATPTAA